jgi:hypothetical protein
MDEDLLNRMREALQAAQLQLEYLDSRFPTGTTPPTLAKIERALKESLAA